MRYFSLALVCFIIVSANAQNFGGNPPQKWAQINTDTVRVIFPRGMEQAANRVASVAAYLQRNADFQYNPKKINLVLQGNTTVSNAYVQLAPYRSELFLTAPQNTFELGGLNWVDNLIVHEWRHVKQYSYFNRGLSKALGVILGQEGRALANALTVPDWFFEGDAVLQETQYTQQGRGRLPLAFSGYKALMLEGKDYSFQKLRNGSLRDLVPNHYDLGYMLVAYGTEKYGNDFWQKVTADASAFKGLFYPLQQAVKRHAGISYKQFVKDALNYYKTQFTTENTNTQQTEWLTKVNSNAVQHYNHPYATADGRVVVVKNSYRKIPAFYKVSADGEERIATKNISLDDYFSYKNGRIVYASFYSDMRWGNRDYSNIILLDVNTKQQRKLTAKGKYFSPDISNDGNTIVAVKMDSSVASSVVLLDKDGNELKTIVSADKETVYSYPKFSANDNSVFVVVRNNNGEMGILQCFMDEIKQKKMIVPFGNYIIGFPVVQDDTILFTASNKTNDAVYAYVNTTGKIYKAAEYPTGLYQGTLLNGKLVTSAYTSEGNRLMSVAPHSTEVTSIPALTDLYVNKSLKGYQTIDQVTTQRYSSSKYSTLSHPFNFHSWRPLYEQPEWSFTLFGQNVLGTVSSELSYIYNENEGSSAVAGTIIYGGTFIQPFVSVQQTFNRTGIDPNVVGGNTFKWNETEFAGGLQLPLQINGGKMFRSLNLSTSFHLQNVNWTGAAKDVLDDIKVNYVQGRIGYASQVQKSRQQVYPHFGQTLTLLYRNATNLQSTYQFLASGNLFLPGLFNNHSIVLNAAYENRDTMSLYRFSNVFPISRGYESDNVNGRLIRSKWKLGANYHFPIVYPEFGIGNIIYFLRLRGNAFYDHSQVHVERTNERFQFRSYGGELFFETRLWNQLPATFGIRYSRLLDAGTLGINQNQWGFILPLDLIP